MEGVIMLDRIAYMIGALVGYFITYLIIYGLTTIFFKFFGLQEMSRGVTLLLYILYCLNILMRDIKQILR